MCVCVFVYLNNFLIIRTIEPETRQPRSAEHRAKERQAQRLVQLCAELCRASQHSLGAKQLPETQDDPGL